MTYLDGARIHVRGARRPGESFVSQARTALRQPHAPCKRLRNRAQSLVDMARQRKRSGMRDNDDFVAVPMYRLVDRHRAILEKIKSREDAEYWGHMLIGEYYPDVPNSRSSSGKMAALVGLTDYMDFYCAFGYYDLLKEGKTLEEARKILGERIANNVKELIRLVDSEKSKKRRTPRPQTKFRKQSKVKAGRKWQEEAFPKPGESLFANDK